MYLFLDIDHTLLNTHRFKKDLATCAGDLGVTPRVFWKTYRALRKKGAFDAETFLHYLPPSFFPRRRGIAKRLTKVIEHVERYMYHDASFFLEWAKREGHTVVLYTYGKRSVQLQKINALRRRHTIYEWVITTDRTKRKNFRQYVRGRTPWIWIDDFDDVPVADRAFRGGTLLALQRKKGKRLRGIPVVRTLYQAIPFIKRASSHRI